MYIYIYHIFIHNLKHTYIIVRFFYKYINIYIYVKSLLSHIILFHPTLTACRRVQVYGQQESPANHRVRRLTLKYWTWPKEIVSFPLKNDDFHWISIVIVWLLHLLMFIYLLWMAILLFRTYVTSFIKGHIDVCHWAAYRATQIDHRTNTAPIYCSDCGSSTRTWGIFPGINNDVGKHAHHMDDPQYSVISQSFSRPVHSHKQFMIFTAVDMISGFFVVSGRRSSGPYNLNIQYVYIYIYICTCITVYICTFIVLH